MKDVEQLKAELSKLVEDYPTSLKPVLCEIKGKGFFPGARGLWEDEDETISDKPIMILGHDFGAERDFKKSVERGCENLNALTWKNLQTTLQEFGIPEDNCFFTNAILGVRTVDSALGKSPAYSYPEFLDLCKSFLLKQINIQKPKLIIVLGLHVLGIISQLSNKFKALEKVKSFKALDGEDLSGFREITFDGIEGYKTNVIIITHPTYRHLNIKYRTIENLLGSKAEKHLFDKFYL